ncbi:equilibrative nucleoside transporter 1-like [Ostrea edulis]|uniref:equilibrative nucleoside transporter 1-like n=1 Tax=Ostrea edulis TaxID=37623 RepID=UPI0024AEF5C7|nr:equilibrative nucleoside transporter 1-like [Ostrea edulis]XP_048746099.2 equilibrative nucleoside transporter 1-like [Ostrea edulis]XP_056005096.1 equilibrative nucleoside transporter 1-like [Ostrea edulis]
MSSKNYYPMETKGSPRSYQPHKNGNLMEKGSEEQTEKFLPVIEPGLDSLNKNPDDLPFIPEEFSTPPDRYRIVFFIMVIHGIGILMPWNMLINAKTYFEEYKLGKNETEVVELKGKFMFYLGIFSQVPNFVMSGVNTFCQCGGQASPRRIIISISIMIVVFIATVILAMLDSSDWSVTFFWITMMTAVILNMATGVYQNSTFGLAAIFPMKYTNAIVLGTNFSGVFIAVVNLICIASAPDPRTQAIYYFVSAIAVLLLSFDAYFLLPLTKFYQHHRALVRRQQSTNSPSRSFSETCSLFGQVLRKIWVQALCVWFVFFVTLTIFPGIWSNITRKNFPIPDNYWVAVFCFLSFNVFAFLGNIASEWKKIPGPRFIWIPVLLRGLFIPFFLFCRFEVENKERTFPILIDNDYVYIVAGIVLAFTSGYYSSLTMMYGPKLVEPEVAGIAGMIMAFCLVMGITTGVNFSLAVASLATQ